MKTVHTSIISLLTVTDISKLLMSDANFFENYEKTPNEPKMVEFFQITHLSYISSDLMADGVTAYLVEIELTHEYGELVEEDLEKYFEMQKKLIELINY